MNTPMLKRQLNPFLLASTVLVLSLLAGMSVMYQGQLSDLVNTRQELNNEINEKDERISNLENQTSTLQARLSNAESDTDRLTTRVNDLEGQVNSLESDKQRLNSQLQQREAELTDVKNERDALQSQVSNLNQQNNELETLLGIMVSRMDSACEVKDENLTDDGEEACDAFDDDSDLDPYR